MKLIFATLLFSVSALAQVQPIEEIFSPNEANYPLAKFTKVAVIQWNPQMSAPIGVPAATVEKYMQNNRNSIAQYVKEAAKNGAELVTTAEFATVGYPDIPELPDEEDNFRNREDLKPFVETIPGPSTKYFSALAKELKVTLHIGLAEVDSTTKNYHNTVVVIGPDGAIITKYRKMHLYQMEENFLVPGKSAVTYTTKNLGKVGIAICSDIYSSQPMTDYASAKLNLLAISTSWASYNSGWSYFKSAATRVRAYTTAANQEYFPDSGVLNPDGTTQSHIRQSNGLAYGFVPRPKSR
ncbi:MAG: carbon-nitrogen hydrolase family protein [Bacteriovoracaceae bacterium]